MILFLVIKEIRFYAERNIEIAIVCCTLIA